MTARYGFAAHPDALLDLRRLPEGIRNRALLELQRLVHGDGTAQPLRGALDGAHKVVLDPEARWRLVVEYRDTRYDLHHDQEVFLIAAGPRRGYTVYRDAQLRLGRINDRDTPSPEQLAAARARSPHALRARNGRQAAASPRTELHPAAAPARNR
ncbi:hypothetical protein [Streptomyces sp. SPB074]|uniref:hypothetical protein n=1 Tax=Streptomyces sp. (strain SPB074) TaxID=465543 RepID=UPI00017F1AE9|nr:hypothetical protein [Streptomyces sp. SPB074]EDY43022.1 conserved hypothetical protein [Streptomyces sp. SPB074]